MLYSWESNQSYASYSSLHFYMKKLQYRIREKWKRHYENFWIVSYLKFSCENYSIWYRQTPNLYFSLLEYAVSLSLLVLSFQQKEMHNKFKLASEYLNGVGWERWVLECNIIKYSNYLKNNHRITILFKQFEKVIPCGYKWQCGLSWFKKSQSHPCL